jgi:hypothetical protein
MGTDPASAADPVGSLLKQKVTQPIFPDKIMHGPRVIKTQGGRT